MRQFRLKIYLKCSQNHHKTIVYIALLYLAVQKRDSNDEPRETGDYKEAFERCAYDQIICFANLSAFYENVTNNQELTERIISDPVRYCRYNSINILSS